MSVAPAAAQRETGPFAGLFGGSPGVERSESLDLRGGVDATYDKTRSEGSNPTPLDPTFQESGAGLGADVSLAYSRGKFSTSGGAVYRQYRDLPGVLSPNVNSTTGFSTNVSKKTTLNVSGSVRYAPYFQFAPFLGVGVPTGLLTPGYGYAATSQTSLGTNATVGLTNQFSKRSSISAGAAYSGWHFFDGSPGGTSGLAGHASYQHNLTRGLSLQSRLPS